MNIFDQDLPKTPANYAQLSPVTFVERAASVYPTHPAVIHGARRYTWQETFTRSRRLASALEKRGIGRGDTVALMLPNTPEMIEAHYGIPALGAVMLPLNIRLDAAQIAYMLEHGEAKVLLTDSEFAPTIKVALASLKRRITVVDVCDSEFGSIHPRLGEIDYEALLDEGDPTWAWRGPHDEWDAIALAYTSGTTGNPKGVVTHHRGAFLNASCNAMTWAMPHHPVYLWTLPMFHCNGWCFPWTIAALAGTHVCLRKVDAAAVFERIRAHGVTHYCGAPIVHSTLINAPATLKAGIAHKVKAMVAGAAPPAAMIEGMAQLGEQGFEITHVYGLTEVYGPAVVCDQQAAWEALPIGEQARLNARQGNRCAMEEAVRVLDPATMLPVPDDGETIGEVMFKGNIVMKGYLKNPAATQAALAGGWFHSGDLAVVYPDGYLKIKDRSKDIIISGGENISSIEIEDVLYRHPAVLACAVVAKPDAKWGETPCAFIELKADVTVSPEDIVRFCKQHLAGFKVPRAVVFGVVPKTSTGKIQKFTLREQAGSAKAIDV